jgi:hypothetical protein
VDTLDRNPCLGRQQRIRLFVGGCEHSKHGEAVAKNNFENKEVHRRTNLAPSIKPRRGMMSAADVLHIGVARGAVGPQPRLILMEDVRLCPA